MVVYLPGGNRVPPYFFSLIMVAILAYESHSQAGSTRGEYVDLWNALQTVDLALSISIIGGFGDSLPTQVNGL